ncbi:hypothetical protein APHAL10511_002971 [Amanita phalloides]|nr:hypothetical protein APHAL10511_002971 [Amanita phalloides]
MGFLGLFSRKSKHLSRPSDDHSSLSASPTAPTSLGDSSAQASTSSSVYPSIASSPSAPSTASTSKLRLPFSRKRLSPPNPARTSTTSVNTAESHSVPHPPFVDRERNSIVSDGELSDVRRLRPPPSKSAIFAAYADPSSALSTRSLPNDAQQPFSLQDPDNSSQHSEAPSRPTSSKKSFFSWAKAVSPAPVAKTKSKSPSPSQPARDPTAVDLSNSSFNLKSFRHVGPSSPPESQVSLAVPNPSPLPRPRGQSVGHADSSQRISVAAFREAQARRSMADSPVPSLRSSSPFGTPQEQSGPASPRLSMLRSSTSHLDGRKSRRGSASDSDADTSASQDESEDESDNEHTLTHRNRWNGKVKAKSEMGHASTKAVNTETRLDISSRARPQPSLAQSGNYHRQRASMSTSAATPSAAAKRASILVNAGDPAAEYKRNSRHIREASVYSNPGIPMSPSDSSEEEDDAPLASLVPPKRPGSSLSNASGSSAAARIRSNSNVPAARGKPLIDINELVGGKSPGMSGRRDDLAEEKGFTKGNTLLVASANASPPISSGTKSPSLIKTSYLSTSPPPLSPTESITSSGFTTAPSSIKAPPFGQSSSSNSNSEQAMSKRDGLSERLLRVAKGTSTASSPLGTPDVNPLPTTDGTKRTVFPRSSASPRSSFSAPTHPAESMGSKISVGGYQHSPPDEELFNILGASVKLISKTGDSSPSEADVRDGVESEDESDEDDSSDDDDDKDLRRNHSKGSDKGTDEWEKVDSNEVKGKEEYRSKDGILKGKSVLNLGKEKGKSGPVQDLAPKVTEPAIAPIPIKQRTPTPSFSVTSRPPLAKGALGTSTSGSGTTSVAPSTTASNGSFTSSSSNGGKTRQRSSTILNPLDARDSSSSTTSTTGSIQVRGRAPGPVAPILRAPATSRGSDQSVKDTGSNTTLNRSSMGDNKQRGSTVMPAISISGAPTMPARPFARRDSPASSTGDSSSGRAPLTPRDGSDIGSVGDSGVGMRPKGGKSGSAMKGSSGLTNAKRRSVCFEDDLIDDSPPPSPGKGRTHQKKDGKESVDEEKRKERRRSEARAAIELGNVINGRRPIVDDEDEDMPINQSMPGRMPSMNPMMGMGNGMHPMPMGSMPSWNGPWGNTMGQQMLNPSQYMLPPVPDPGLLAAHQQAMMIAKQAYQMAVAQQAAVAAGDEWERGSVVSGYGGGSMFGGGRMPAGPMSSPYGMGGMGGMGMGMNMNMMNMGSNWSSAGSTAFPPSSRSMFGGISASRSEYGGGGAGGGGGGGGGGWNSARSTYGEPFGPPTGRAPKLGMSDRDWREPGHMPPVPPVPPQQASSAGRTSARTRTSSQPSSVKSAGQRRPAPPSSWKGS